MSFDERADRDALVTDEPAEPYVWSFGTYEGITIHEDEDEKPKRGIFDLTPAPKQVLTGEYTILETDDRSERYRKINQSNQNKWDAFRVRRALTALKRRAHGHAELPVI